MLDAVTDLRVVFFHDAIQNWCSMENLTPHHNMKLLDLWQTQQEMGMPELKKHEHLDF